MSGIFQTGEAAIADTLADRVIDEFIPDRNGIIGRVAETGVNQFVNNEINSELAPGALGGGLY